MASTETRFPGVVGSDGPRVELSMSSSPLVTGAVRRPHTSETPAPYISTGSPAPVCVDVTGRHPQFSSASEVIEDRKSDTPHRSSDCAGSCATPTGGSRPKLTNSTPNPSTCIVSGRKSRSASGRAPASRAATDGFSCSTTLPPAGRVLSRQHHALT